MNTTTVKRAAAALALVASAMLGSAAAAQATGTPIPLAEGSKLSFFSCDAGGLATVDLSTLEANVLDTSEGCGEAPGGSAYVVTATYNPIDAHIYAVALYSQPGQQQTSKLLSVDLQGRVQSGYPVAFSGNSAQVGAIAVDPRDGNAWAFSSDGKLSNLNLETGELTNAADLTPSISPSIAGFSPSGELYVYNFRNEGLYRIDVNAATATENTSLVAIDLPNGYTMFGFGYDANGNMFISDNADNQDDPNNGYPVLFSVNPEDGFASALPFTAPAPGDFGHPWTGDPQNPTYVDVSGLVITYGNLAVNFDAQGGSPAAASRFYSSTVLNSVDPPMTNSPVTLPTTTRDGYRFDGWFDAASGGTLVGQPGDQIVPDADASYTLYAHWTSTATLASTGLDVSSTMPIVVALLVSGVGIAAASRRYARR